MHFLLELSSSANLDLNFGVSKLSKNSVLCVQMTHWTHSWLSLWCELDYDVFCVVSRLVSAEWW